MANTPEKKGSRRHDALLLSVFVLYILILLLLLFGKPNAWRGLNLTPLFSIRGYLMHRMPMAASNLLGNVVLFIPLGIYLSLFYKNKRSWLPLLWVGLISIAAESAQYFFHIGSADIDDVLLNVVGGFIGMMIYRVLLRIFRERSRRIIEYAALAVGLMFVAAFVCLSTGIFGIRIRIF